MNKALRYGLIVAALSGWLCLQTEWGLPAVLSGVLYVGALCLALISISGSGRVLLTALFWLYFGGTYISSSVEGYAFGLLTLEKSAYVLAHGAVISFLVSLGLVWASGRMDESDGSAIATEWRWGPAIAAAFAFVFLICWQEQRSFRKSAASTRISRSRPFLRFWLFRSREVLSGSPSSFLACVALNRADEPC